RGGKIRLGQGDLLQDDDAVFLIDLGAGAKPDNAEGGMRGSLAFHCHGSLGLQAVLTPLLDLGLIERQCEIAGGNLTRPAWVDGRARWMAGRLVGGSLGIGGPGGNYEER